MNTEFEINTNGCEYSDWKYNFVLVSGKAQSGKDTISDYLVKNYNFEKIAFATALKNCLRQFSDWDGQKDEAGRKLLQSVGQAFREYDKDNWVKLLLIEIEAKIYHLYIKNYATKNINFVISDVRFINEIVRFKELIQKRIPKANFITIRVERPSLDNDTWRKDISETELDNYKDFDYTVNNDSDIETLYQKIDKIIRENI